MLDKYTADKGAPYAVLDRCDPDVVCMVCCEPIKISDSLIPADGSKIEYECVVCGNIIQFWRT